MDILTALEDVHTLVHQAQGCAEDAIRALDALRVCYGPRLGSQVAYDTLRAAQALPQATSAPGAEAPSVAVAALSATLYHTDSDVERQRAGQLLAAARGVLADVEEVERCIAGARHRGAALVLLPSGVLEAMMARSCNIGALRALRAALGELRQRLDEY